MGILEFISSYPLQEVNYPAKSIILQEGSKARYVYFVRKGCLRMWINSKGKDITTQFFFEGAAIASLESLFKDEASDFTLETVEASSLFRMSKEEFLILKATDPSFRSWFEELLLTRFFHYSKHLLGYLRLKPQERYQQLLAKHPEILLRIPQQFIASYLGITAVSLSRIRSRKSPIS